MAVSYTTPQGNGIFSQGQKATKGLTAGTHYGTITEIDTRYGDDGNCYHIFRGHVEINGSKEKVSAIAGDDTKKTRKLVRWMLALAGKTPDDIDDAFDLSTLPTSGNALFEITYTQRKRQADGKYRDVPTEFPQLADILPLPSNVPF